jgi:hypothetical protein
LGLGFLACLSRAAARPALNEEDVNGLVAALSPDFYIDADSVRSAVVSQRLFNLMHLAQ